jgi:flagellar basal body rod protein FlgC
MSNRNHRVKRAKLSRVVQSTEFGLGLQATQDNEETTPFQSQVVGLHSQDYQLQTPALQAEPEPQTLLALAVDAAVQLADVIVTSESLQLQLQPHHTLATEPSQPETATVADVTSAEDTDKQQIAYEKKRKIMHDQKKAVSACHAKEAAALQQLEQKKAEWQRSAAEGWALLVEQEAASTIKMAALSSRLNSIREKIDEHEDTWFAENFHKFTDGTESAGAGTAAQEPN